MSKRQIEWSLDAKSDVTEILQWYKSKSETGFQIIKKSIKETLDKIAHSPEIFQIDEFKIPHDKSIRSFVI